MRHKIISVSKAKASLLELTRNLHEEGNAYLLTKDGEPIGALVPLEDYESLLETSDVLDSSSTRQLLKRALDDEKQGRLWQRNSQGQWIKSKKSSRKKAA